MKHQRHSVSRTEIFCHVTAQCLLVPTLRKRVMYSRGNWHHYVIR